MWGFTFVNNVVRFQNLLLGRKRRIPPAVPTSKGEKAIAEVLTKNGIRYEMQYELGYFVHADFVVYHNGRMSLIEYDGQQHFRPVKMFGGRWKFFLQWIRDTFENWECKDRKIPMLRIGYKVTGTDNIEKVIMSFLHSGKMFEKINKTNIR